jgi:iron complex transport system substrate-binding protein
MIKKIRVTIGLLIFSIAVTVSCTNGNKLSNKNEQDASRIVTLNGAVTEILCAFGLENQIVGVDVTSNYPASMQQKEKIGYVRSLSAEKVLALSPSMIIGTDDGVNPELVNQFKTAQVNTLIINHNFSIDGTKGTIKLLAENFNKQSIADELIKKIDEDLSKVEQLSTSPKVLFIYARGAGALMVAGNHTAAKSMIELAGGQNAITGFNDFKPLTPEALVEANPDIILMFGSGLQSLGGMDGLLTVPGIAQTNAGKNKRVIEMEGQFLSGFGPRVAQAVIHLNQQFKLAIN